ncbi:Gfo/Idh/MocA family oxidoreductase [Asanoa sp. WMMD1127]|uniref:Gfo/Idh/MocA family protein n=1 Tax=Asanoa sp. WMMD1127 TaxID=3016107 RepID=UPI0024166B35|nr:Gfo/Idh/MocA family oxidoreductase [Asanoa sp. WMMD1127]MDG4821408.1 Gfo/Idh/MocA family oxidoreductase [Asanoa sp. WMMD1127]
MDRTGIVLVGAGFIADAHSGAIGADPRAELVGIVDADPGRAAAFARKQGGIRQATDLDTALAWPGVDAVILCTPNDTHAPIGLRVAAAGKHLLVEKPLATTVADAESLAAAFDEAGRVLVAAHTHRFYDYGRAVKATIDSGAIGRPKLVRLAILGGWIWPDWSAWVGDPARSGGHALHNGVHLLDLATWWLGAEPATVFARGRKQTAAELRIYDYLEMVVTYADGTTAVCEMSRAHRPGSIAQRELLVTGTAGIVEQGWDGEASLVFGESGTAALPAAGGNGFAAQLGAWLDAIGGAPPAMPVADAVRAVRLGVAVEESIATGQPVAVAA